MKKVNSCKLTKLKLTIGELNIKFNNFYSKN